MVTTRRQQVEPTRSQRRRRASAAFSSPSDLCITCKQIDLDVVLSETHRTKTGKTLRTLGPSNSWSVNSCTLCQLLLHLIPTEKKESKCHKLRSLSSRKISARGWQAVDTSMLAIDSGSAYLLEQPAESSFVRLIQPKVDPEIIKSWLDYCQEHHSSACRGGSGLPPSDAAASPLSEIASFKLIDCETRKIVSGCSSQYVALSYVWGAGESGPGFARALPPGLPETIEDAIQVTRSLGMRYLWIDRFCINQSDPSEVREQVGKMDMIYSYAYLTIIAAAGASPTYGLPGVGNRCRQTQPHGTVRGYTLVSTLPDPRKEIQSSKWFQRGWTYQEGLLSPRRLVFTDAQVYFECNGMYCCEALNLPLRDLHTRNGQRFKAEVCGSINIGMFPRGIGTSAWEIVQRIEDYTKRHLTNPSDILDGFSGIFQAFAKSRKRVLHCAGVPMIPADSRREVEPKSKPYLEEWTPLTGFCMGLYWGFRSTVERRDGFPSWSWTGWRGEVRWGFEEILLHLLKPNKDLQISIELDNGRIVDLDMFYRSYDDLMAKPSGTLHITTATFPLPIHKSIEPQWYPLRHYAMVELEDGKYFEWWFEATSTAPILPDDKCMGIHLCHTVEEYFARDLYILVVREVESGVYERVGLNTMSGNNVLGFGFTPMLPLPAPRVAWKEFQLR